MKITQKKNKKLIIAIAIIAILLAGLSYYVFALNGSLFGWQFHKEEASSINMDPPTDEQVKTGQDAKAQTIEEDQGKPGVGNDTSTPNPSDTITIGFSAINQNDGKLQIRTMIQEVLSTGQCNLTLTDGDKTVSKSATVYPNASISTCQGFDVPVSELSSSTWSITINVTSGDRSGQATTSFQVN